MKKTTKLLSVAVGSLFLTSATFAACDIDNCLMVNVDQSVTSVVFFADPSNPIEGGPWGHLTAGNYAWEPKFYNGKSVPFYISEGNVMVNGKPINIWGTYLVSFNNNVVKPASITISAKSGKTSDGASCTALSVVGSGVTVTSYSPPIRVENVKQCNIQ